MESDPFADELTLPQLPALPKDSRERETSGRKRAYPFRAPSTEGIPSSDIGVFSSDDDPALDNYVQVRQKRRYRGTWYDHNHMMSDPCRDDDDSPEDVIPETPKAKPRASRTDDVARKASSKPATGFGHPPPTPPSSNTVPTRAFTPNRGIPSSQGYPSSQPFSPGQRFASSQGLPSSQGYSTEPARKQSALVQEIEKRIDRGESVIDLAHIGLDNDSISVDTFRPLIDLSLVPRVKTRTQRPVGTRSRDPLTTSKDGYLHRESPIVLLMANNRLSRVPATLFDIGNLVELSLRHNRLTEIPPAVAKCRNLRSLNLSFNRLRWLPYELVELLPRLRELNTVGNDFYEPDPSCIEGWSFEGPRCISPDSPDLPEHSAQDRRSLPNPEGSIHSRMAAWYIGRGAVQYSDTSGRVYSSFRLPPAGGQANKISLQAPDEMTAPLTHYHGEPQSRSGSNQGFGTTRVPSLVELCTRSLARSGQPEDLADMSGEEDIFGTVSDAAIQSKLRGGEHCAVCKKFFVIPRVQWVDFFFHQVATFERVSSSPVSERPARTTPEQSVVLRDLIPCLRRGCSWKCVPYGRELRSGEMVRSDIDGANASSPI